MATARGDLGSYSYMNMVYGSGFRVRGNVGVAISFNILIEIRLSRLGLGLRSVIIIIRSMLAMGRT